MDHFDPRSQVAFELGCFEHVNRIELTPWPDATIEHLVERAITIANTVKPAAVAFHFDGVQMVVNSHTRQNDAIRGYRFTKKLHQSLDRVTSARSSSAG